MRKTNFNDWYLKKDTPIWITADFESKNQPLESANEDDSMAKFFVNKKVANGYNIVKNSDYGILTLKKEGCRK